MKSILSVLHKQRYYSTANSEIIATENGQHNVNFKSYETVNGYQITFCNKM